MDSLSFNRELAIALYQSSEDFPVDFDLAWQWLGYTRKDNAKRILVSEFEHGIDFSSEVRKTSSGGRPTEFIMLSIDCFKSLGMMAGTEQGKAIRRYFLECERIAKASIKQNNRTAIGAYKERVEAMFDAANKIPDGYWCVLHESANLLIWVESKLKYPVDKADLLDGSIGICWSNFRKGKPWAGDKIKFSYRFPDGRYCNPWCYGMDELIHFRHFLDRDYKPVALPKYLESKYSAIVAM